jgi:hypothetical protein
MSYTVSCTVRDDSSPLSVSFNSIDDALEHARSSLAKGMKNVAIRDPNRNQISGADLQACCDGRRILTNDLQAF